MSYARKGRELASKLAPAIGSTPEVGRVCSLICRNAAILHRLNEEAHNGYRFNGESGLPAEWVGRLQAARVARVERNKERTVARLHALIEALPNTSVGPFKLEPEFGQERCTVLILPEGSGIRADDETGRGVVIP
jgi:hypothetical protein